MSQAQGLWPSVRGAAWSNQKMQTLTGTDQLVLRSSSSQFLIIRSLARKWAWVGYLHSSDSQGTSPQKHSGTRSHCTHTRVHWLTSTHSSLRALWERFVLVMISLQLSRTIKKVGDLC